MGSIEKYSSQEEVKKERRHHDGASFWYLRYGNALIQVHILDGVQDLDAFRHRALEGLAAGDQALAAGALVDHCGGRGFGEVILAGGAAAVDEADAAQ